MSNPKKVSTPELNRALKQLLSELPSIENPDTIGIEVAELARLVGVKYPVAYRWIHSGDDGKKGGFGPGPAMLAEIEDRLGVIRGEVYQRCGLSKRVMSVVDILRNDESLLMEERNAVVDFYLLAKERSAVKRMRRESSESASSDAKVIDAS